MPNLWLVLGQERLLEAGDASLPALCGLCRALGVRTHWDEGSHTLYIASPFMGRHLVIESAANDNPVFEQVAGRIAAGLKGRVESAGGRVTIARGPGEMRSGDLLLILSIGGQRSWGVGAVYRWLTGEAPRTAAALLSWAVAEETGLPHLGARLSLVAGRQSGLPAVEVQIGRPAGANTARLNNEEFSDSVVEGVYQGLMRLWSAPMQAAIPVPLEGSDPAEPAEIPGAAFPSPEAAGVPVEYVQAVAQPGEEAPRIVLLPEWSHSVEVLPDPAAAPDPEPDPEPARADPPPVIIADACTPEPEPEPAPEPRLVLTASSGTPIPFKFLPFSDPRRVPGASQVLVFRREPAAVAPPPDPVPSALEEFFRQPPPPPEPEPEVSPEPAAPELVSLTSARPAKKRPAPRQVRVIQ